MVELLGGERVTGLADRLEVSASIARPFVRVTVGGQTDQLVEGGWQLWDPVGGGRDTGVDVLEGDVDRGLAVDGPGARQQLEEDEPGGVHVAAGIGDPALHLLGGEVGDGAVEDAVVGGRRLGGDRPGQTEVRDLDGAAVGDEDVLGLDVPVDVARLVRGGQPGEHRVHEVERGPRRQGPLGVDDRAERAALDVLHREEDPPRVLALVEDRDDVGVAQPGGRAGFPAEAGDEGRVGRQVGAHDLEGDLPVQPGVGGEQDRGHAAVGEVSEHPVSTVDELADEGMGCRGHRHSVSTPPSLAAHMRLRRYLTLATYCLVSAYMPLASTEARPW